MPRAAAAGARSTTSRSVRASARLIGRNTADPARWKRYRGGTAGALWIDAEGNGTFRRMTELDGQPHQPDVDRRPRLVPRPTPTASATSTRACPTAASCARHTDHDDFYARHAQTDGKRIVYQCGAKIWLFDPASARRPRGRHPHARRTARRRRASSSPAAEHLGVVPRPSGRPQRSRSTRAASCSRSRCGKARCASTATTDGGRHAPWPVARRRQRRWSRSSDASRRGARRAVRRRRASRTLPWDIGHVVAMRAAPKGGRVAHRQSSQRGADRRRRQRHAHRHRPQRRRPQRRPRLVARRRLARLHLLDEHAALRDQAARRRRRDAARSSRSRSSATTRRRSIPTASTSTSCRCAPSIRSTTACSSSSSFPRAARPYLIALQAGGRAAVRSAARRA